MRLQMGYLFKLSVSILVTPVLIVILPYAFLALNQEQTMLDCHIYSWERVFLFATMEDSTIKALDSVKCAAPNVRIVKEVLIIALRVVKENSHTSLIMIASATVLQDLETSYLRSNVKSVSLPASLVGKRSTHALLATKLLISLGSSTTNACKVALQM